ncbi:hypothetical protein [Streptomyces sp. HPF1205]|uniref:hypothetical protein n=1 Tax=Streptomyces sp. HPF1205 TaxID=2873262 RepID=UPI001CEDFBD6|nr:hypothetical protein [Streptomyces sp. HPF1205]
MTAHPDTTAWPPLEGAAAVHGPALLDWAAGPGRARYCLVKGARGSGKSQLLAWFLSGSAADPRTTVHATVLSAGLFTDPFGWEVGRQLGYGPTPPDELLRRLAVDQRPLLLLVPDLHRAGRGPKDRPPADPATLVRELLVPLLELPQTRAVIEVGQSGLLDEWARGRFVETIDVGDGAYAGVREGEGGAPAPAGDLAEQLVRTPEGRPRWDLAPEEVREHALDEALSGPDPDTAVRALITDPGFLVHGSPVAIAACLADERVVTPPGLRHTWRLAAPQLSDPDIVHDTPRRAALLHAAALGASPALARYLREPAAADVFTALWARTDTAVAALAPVPPGTVPEGTTDTRPAPDSIPGRAERPADLVAADPLGAVVVLDGDSGRTTGGVPVTAANTVRAQSVAVCRDGSLFLLGESGVLRPAREGPSYSSSPSYPAYPSYEKDGTAAVLARIAAHHGQAALRDPAAVPAALGQSPDGDVLVVGDEGGGVHVWRLDTPAPGDVPLSRPLHPAPITAVTCLQLPDDKLTLVMSAGMDGAVRLWEPSAEPMPTPVEQRPALPTALSAAHTPRGPVLAIAWNDATVTLWHIPTGRVHRLPLLTPATSLALTSTPSPRLAFAGPEGVWTLSLDATRLWD